MGVIGSVVWGFQNNIMGMMGGRDRNYAASWPPARNLKSVNPGITDGFEKNNNNNNMKIKELSKTAKILGKVRYFFQYEIYVILHNVIFNLFHL